MLTDNHQTTTKTILCASRTKMFSATSLYLSASEELVVKSRHRAFANDSSICNHHIHLRTPLNARLDVVSAPSSFIGAQNNDDRRCSAPVAVASLRPKQRFWRKIFVVTWWRQQTNTNTQKLDSRARSNFRLIERKLLLVPSSRTIVVALLHALSFVCERRCEMRDPNARIVSLSRSICTHAENKLVELIDIVARSALHPVADLLVGAAKSCLDV